MCRCNFESEAAAIVKLGPKSNSQSNSLSYATLTNRPRQIWSFLQWLFPVATVVLMPKCPACFAATVLLATGVGLSIPVAGIVRGGLIGLSVAAFVWCLLRRDTTRVTSEINDVVSLGPER